MAVDMFLKLDGIDGESLDDTYAKYIDVISWNWGASQSGSVHMGGGAGSGKASFQDLSITKYVDASSHKLWKSVSIGAHIKEAKLIVRKAGEKPLDYIVLTMTNCLITSINAGGSGGEDRLMENITINFEEYEFAYTPQKEDGSGDSVLPFKFSISKNS